jgi:hypothetical protein
MSSLKVSQFANIAELASAFRSVAPFSALLRQTSAASKFLEPLRRTSNFQDKTFQKRLNHMNTQKQVITEEVAKAKARALCTALAELGVVSDLKSRKALEVIARLENEKNWSTLNARQKAQARGTSAKAQPVRNEYCCGVCDGTRVIEDSQGAVWPCHQCLPSIGAKTRELPDSDRLTQPYLRGTKLLSLGQTAALWQRLQSISCADEGPLVLDDTFLHFRCGDYLEDAEAWLVAMCVHSQFSLEKARNGEYWKMSQRENVDNLVRRLSSYRWRVQFCVKDKYGKNQTSFVHAYPTKEDAWAAVEVCFSEQMYAWYEISWVGTGIKPSLDEVAEWTGLHYGENFSTAAPWRRHHWVQRFKLAQDWTTD